MTGDEVGVQVRFDDVLDLQPLLLGGVEVDIDVALRINDRRDAFRTDQIGSVRQAPQEEMFHQNRCHNFSQRSVSDVRQARRIYYATENPRPGLLTSGRRHRLLGTLGLGRTTSPRVHRE